MDYPKEEKHSCNIENKNTESSEELLHFYEEPVVFVPAEYIRAIEKVISNWEAVKLQWDNIVQTETL